jgi:ABC-type dipeptide/oligopeptide/nickel transport system permease subunit
MSDLAISNQARFAKMTRLRRFFRWLVMFPAPARIVRARTLTVRRELYVDASRCFGAPAWHILWKHVLPNSLQPVIVR